MNTARKDTASFVSALGCGLPDADGYIIPVTQAGSHFVAGFDPDASPGSFKGYKVPPTAVLYKEGGTLSFWALQEPVADTDLDLLKVVDALGMAGVDEPLPTPGVNGWSLEHCSNDSYPLSALTTAYVAVADDGQTEGPDGEAGGVSEANSTGYYKAGELYGDALCISDYDEAKQSASLVVTYGTKKDSTDWRPKPMHVGNLVALLSKHKKGRKDGDSIVLGDMVPGQRLKTKVISLFACGIDIDTGTPTEEIDEKLKGLKCLAVRHTSYTNGCTTTDIKKDPVLKFADGRDIDDALMREYVSTQKKWHPAISEYVKLVGDDHTDQGIVVRIEHPPMPKNRVIIPFLFPFVMKDVAPMQADAMKMWEKVLAALARHLDLPFDPSTTDPCRLFYLPRHPAGGDWSISLHGSDNYFDWRTLDLGDPMDRLDKALSGGKSFSTTEGGRKLGGWWKEYGHGFQAADFVETYAFDRVRHNTGHGLEIMCPFDEYHTNHGDPEDRACFVVNATEGQSDSFVFSCRHQSCKDKSKLDMLAKLVADESISHEALTAQDFNAIIDEPTNSDPSPKKSETSKENIKDSIESLAKGAGDQLVEGVLRLIASVGPSELEVESALLKIRNRTGYGIKTLRKSLHRFQAEMSPAGNGSDAAKGSDNLVKALGTSLGRPFDLPAQHIENCFLERVEENIWISRYAKSNDGRAERLCTPFVLVGGIVYADRDEAHAFRVDVLNPEGKWTPVEIDAAALASTTCTGALEQLLRAGLTFSTEGREFIINCLMLSRPKGITVYHRPGFRDGAFVCPTGDVLLASQAVELASDVRLKCKAKAGTLDRWTTAAHALFAVPTAYRFKAGVLMGFAGTLSDLAGDDSLAFSLEGASTLGKSTNEMTSVANWCNPKLGEGLFLRAKGTENSQEFPLERGSGTVTALDEIGELPAKAQQELMFMNQAGMAKRRMSKSGAPQHTRQWGGGALIVSAETGFAQRLNMENVKQLGGLSARVLAVHFDEDARLEPEQFAHVKAILANFGWSGPAFVQALADQGYVADPSKVRTEVAQLLARLPSTSGPENVYRMRAARPVAYLWLAGKIAARAGLLPAKYSYSKLAKRLWTEAMASEIGPTDPIDRAISTLCDSITSRKGADMIEFAQRDTAYREVVGFFNATVGTQPVYVLRSAKLSELSGGFVDDKALRKKLDERGYLVRSKDGDARTWSGFPGLGKEAQYVVLAMKEVDAV